MGANEAASRSSPVRRCALLGCGLGVTLAVALGLYLPAYPRHKQRCFERLRRATPEAVVTEGRELMDQVAPEQTTPKPWSQVPPAIASLGADEVLVSHQAVWVVYRDLGAQNGFVILREEGAIEADRVAPGLAWTDNWDAPDDMRGVPAGWND
jgi:hypothetical protein